MSINNWISAKSVNEPATRKIYDAAGSKLKLTSKEKLAEGGESLVFNVPGHDDLVLKVWRTQTIADASRCAKAGRRLEKQVALESVKSLDFLAWPVGIAYSNAKATEICGYAMRKARGSTSLASFMSGDAGVRSAFGPKANRLLLAKVALRYVENILEMAEHGCVPTDFNPRNVLVSIGPDDEPKLTWIDTDSFQFVDRSGTVQTTGVHFPAYLAPELFAADALAKPRTKASTEFSASLVAFAVLTLGGSPYSFTDARDGSVMGDPVENLKRGICGLGGGNEQAKLDDRTYKQVNQMSYRMKGFFIRMHREGHSVVSVRPPLAELADELKKFIYVLGVDPSRLPLIPSGAVRRHWVGHDNTSPYHQQAPVRFAQGFGSSRYQRVGNGYRRPVGSYSQY